MLAILAPAVVPFLCGILSGLYKRILSVVNYFRMLFRPDHPDRVTLSLSRVTLRIPDVGYVHPRVDLSRDFWHLFASLDIMGYSLPLDRVGIRIGGKRIWDYTRTLDSLGVKPEDIIQLYFYFGEGGSGGAGKRPGPSDIPSKRKKPKMSQDAEQWCGGLKADYEAREKDLKKKWAERLQKRDSELEGLRANVADYKARNKAEVKKVKDLQESLERIKQKTENERLKAENERLKQQLNGTNQRAVPEGTGVHPFTYPDKEIDRVRELCIRDRSAAHISTYLNALGDRGLWALGYYFERILNRLDTPSLLTRSERDFISIPLAKRLDLLGVHLLAHTEIAIPTAGEVRTYYTQRSASPGGIPSGYYPSAPNMNIPNPNGSPLFQPPQMNGISHPPNKPISQLSVTDLQSLISSTVQQQLHNGRPPTHSQLHHRATTMGTNFYGSSSLQDPTNLYTPVSRQKALEMVDNFLKGKSTADFSLTELRKAMCPGTSLFDPKNRGDVAELMFAINNRVTELHKNKEIDDSRHRILTGQLKSANVSLMNVNNREAMKSILDAWHQGIRDELSLCSNRFLVMALNSSNTSTRTNTTRASGNGYGSNRRCWTCHETTHSQRNCPYRQGKPFPPDRICASFNNGTCRKTNCHLLHFCSKCLSPPSHRAIDCRRA